MSLLHPCVATAQVQSSCGMGCMAGVVRTAVPKTALPLRDHPLPLRYHATLYHSNLRWAFTVTGRRPHGPFVLHDMNGRMYWLVPCAPTAILSWLSCIVLKRVGDGPSQLDLSLAWCNLTTWRRASLSQHVQCGSYSLLFCTVHDTPSVTKWCCSICRARAMLTRSYSCAAGAYFSPVYTTHQS